MWIEVSVPEVIDCAAGSAHDESAAEEEEGGADD